MSWGSSLNRAAALGALVLLAGCAPAPAVGTRQFAEQTGGQHAAEAQVVVTVAMVGDLVRAAGGPEVQVVQLMGAGVDPHLYKITRDDVRAFFAADAIFLSGLMLEGKMTHALRQMAKRKSVIAVAETLPQDRLLGSGNLPTHAVANDHPDPHVWMDVSLWSEGLPTVTQSLIALAPQHENEFRERAARYRDELMSLHQYGVEAIKTIPPQRRHLITSHDAFGYFGRAYGLDVTGVQGLSTDSEAGLMRINGLIDLIVKQQIGAVFVESSVPRKSLEAVIEGAAARGHHVVIGGELYSDSGGPAGTYEGSYIGMMDHNITVITRALGGDAPAAGFRGRLSVHLELSVHGDRPEHQRAGKLP